MHTFKYSLLSQVYTYLYNDIKNEYINHIKLLHPYAFYKAYIISYDL